MFRSFSLGRAVAEAVTTPKQKNVGTTLVQGGVLTLTAILLATGESLASSIHIQQIYSSTQGIFEVHGSGFFGTSRVMFLTDGAQYQYDVAYSLQTDARLLVNSYVNPETIVIFTSSGMGVGFRQGGYIDITHSQSSGEGSRAYLVQNEVDLLAGFGSSVVFLEANASYAGGGGSNFIFAKAGATVDIGGGGSNAIFKEDNVTVISGGGGSNHVTLVPEVHLSVFSGVPEPASLTLLALGGLVLLRRRA